MVETITLDELDRQLTQCLGVDGRASFSQIAEILGVSDQTVARRYRRLRSAGVLRVVGLKSRPKALGWFLRMRCVPGAGPAIAAALARRTDTAWIQLLSGNTEVLCTLRGDDPPAAGQLGEQRVAVTAHSLLHMFTGGPDALAFLEVLPAERVEPLRQPADGGGHVEPGELDAALFEALGTDGRTPYADLAAAAGWSESTVRRRVEQLRAAGVLYFDLELDMPAFGFRSSTWLWMSVTPSELAAAGTALAKFPEIAYAAATTGTANLAACAVCRDESAFYHFLTEKVGSLAGVERTETAPIIRTIKQASTVMVPGYFSSERASATL
ncbi:MAG TPA: AsnC family transcriptional regulator [Trebonia sp.]|nr:AsnC family transcriptional regulator [Trebonia sp.]